MAWSLGWAPRKANVEFPVGYDDFSFGMRDIDGAKINGALRQQYGQKFGLCAIQYRQDQTWMWT